MIRRANPKARQMLWLVALSIMINLMNKAGLAKLELSRN